MTTLQLASDVIYQFTSQSNSVVIKFEAGPVSIEAGIRDRIDVIWSLTQGDISRFGMEAREGPELTIIGARKGTNAPDLQVALNVRIPNGCAVEVSNDGGAVSLKGEAARASITARGGDIDVERANNGGVFQASGGSVRVMNVAGQVAAEADGGGVFVQFETVMAGDLNTSGGTIELEVPRTASFELSADANGGYVTLIDLVAPGELRVGRFHGPIHGGGPNRLAAEASGGDVRIRGI